MSGASKLPSFLIIGAMKSGTTTLFTDLTSHPRIFGPEHKEPGTLKDDGIRTPRLRHWYESIFESAAPDQITFEASTEYTHLPKFTGVPERAREILGPELRVVYIVREPIARIISHHHHLLSKARIDSDIDKAVRNDSRLIDYSKYAMQARPWIETLGQDRVLVMRFDEMVALRREFVARVEGFVGVEPRPDLVDDSQVENRSEGKAVPFQMVEKAKRSALFARFKPLVLSMPRPARKLVKSLTTTTTDVKPKIPTDETGELILDALAEDYAALAAILRHPNGGPAPVWTREQSMDALRRRRVKAQAAPDASREQA